MNEDKQITPPSENMELPGTEQNEFSSPGSPPCAGAERRIAHYSVLQKIAEGGMGIVYKAKDEKLDRICALKVLNPKLAQDEKYRERFIREARAAAQLNHPNIVAVYEADEENGQLFIAMEFVEGENSAELLRRVGRLKLEDACRIVRDTARALAAAHEKGIIHRDVKPGNIMITRNGQVKLADFGLAKKMAEKPTFTSPGRRFGTPYYMSPEQCEGKELDGRSDIYSLGATFFTLLTGKLPALGFDLKAECPGLPKDVYEIFQKMIAPEVKNRYPNAAQVADDLDRYIVEPAISAEPVSSAHPPDKRSDATDVSPSPSYPDTIPVIPSPPRSVIPAVATVFVLAVAAAIGYFVWTQKPRPPSPTPEHPHLSALTRPAPSATSPPTPKEESISTPASASQPSGSDDLKRESEARTLFESASQHHAQKNWDAALEKIKQLETGYASAQFTKERTKQLSELRVDCEAAVFLDRARRLYDARDFDGALPLLHKLSSAPYKNAPSIRAEEREIHKMRLVAATPKGMVLIPAGGFLMGSESGLENEKPIQEVFLPAYYIDIHEVTNAEYRMFVEATGHPAPPYWNGPNPPPGRENYPVVEVSWEDACAYARWAGKRLPTEAEWEKAARGPEGNTYPWGIAWNPDALNLDPNKQFPVMSFEAGKSPYGCYDMAGSVWEWTASLYEPYKGNTFKSEYHGKARITRGGVILDPKLPDAARQTARSSFRGITPPETKSPRIGFRCAKDAE